MEEGERGRSRGAYCVVGGNLRERKRELIRRDQPARIRQDKAVCKGARGRERRERRGREWGDTRPRQRDGWLALSCFFGANVLFFCCKRAVSRGEADGFASRLPWALLPLLPQNREARGGNIVFALPWKSRCKSTCGQKGKCGNMKREKAIFNIIILIFFCYIFPF